MSLAVLILAAGKGSRMNSDIPKVLHEISRKPVIKYVLDTAEKVKPDKTVIVLGHDSEFIEKIIENYNCDIAYQTEQLGTGHAVLSSKKSLSNINGQILVLSGDVPSISIKTLKKLVNYHVKNNFKISLLTTYVDNPTGYGRIIRNEAGNLTDIIEEKDADSRQKKIKEINSGIYCFDSKYLWKNIDRLNTNNKQNEYYLPGLVNIAVSDRLKIGVIVVPDSSEVLGINTRGELINMEKYINSDSIQKLINKGVTIIDPSTTFISPDVKIGRDTIINPNTYIHGKTVIGKKCNIGPSVYIEDSSVGDEVTIRFSCYIVNAKIESNVIMGPFCHIRPDTLIKKNAKIGNFVEIKKSEIGAGSKVPHLSYVGDATLGKNVNIGAGTITCNYDGVNKNRTIIEDNVFIGSDTMLVAPVKIGKEATTAAGSTITKDVSSGSLAIERSPQKEVAGWNKRIKTKKKK